jgi:hypothetical protein
VPREDGQVIRELGGVALWSTFLRKPSNRGMTILTAQIRSLGGAPTVARYAHMRQGGLTQREAMDS